MNKKLLLTILTMIIIVVANSQCENFEWAKRIDAGRVSERVTTDHLGNIFTLANNVDQNIFVNTENFITKHNAQGDSLWTAVIKNININTANNDYSTMAYDFVTDNTGNLYITGWFQQHVDFDPGVSTHIISSDASPVGFNMIHSRDAFILKLDANGNFVWAKKYAGTFASTPDEFWTLTIDNTGNIYAAGKNSIGGLLYKINSANGNIIWQKDIVGNEPRITFSNTNNHLYLTGNFDGTKDFDPGASVYNLTSGGLKDVYIMKLDTAGNFVWVKQLGGAGQDAGKSLTTDAAGDIFVTGYYSSTATYQNNATSFTLPSGNGSNRNIFIAKMNSSDGNFTWVSWFKDASAVSGSINEEGTGIALDHSGNIYVTGYYIRQGLTSDGQIIASNSTINVILFKLNNSTGNFTWIKSIAGSASDSGKDIAVDPDDNILITGLYNDKLTAIGYTNWPSQDSIDFDPSPQTTSYLFDQGGLTNRFLLKLGSNQKTAIDHTMCDAELFDFNGNLLTDAGIYYDTLTNISGCDSIVKLTLQVSEINSDSIFITIDQGDVYDFNGDLVSVAGVYFDTLTNTNGCDSLLILTLSVDSTTSVENHNIIPEIKIYPNPTKGEVYFSQTVNVHVANALGQIIISMNNVNSLNLTDQSTGIYFVTFTNNKGKMIQRSKILIQ